MLYKDLSYHVIGCCIKVHRALGSGLLEQCYHNALFYEVRDSGFSVEYNTPYTVMYNSRVVGEYFADLVVENKIIVELKSVSSLSDVHKAQLINYLRISGCRVGYLVNFHGKKLDFIRMVV